MTTPAQIRKQIATLQLQTITLATALPLALDHLRLKLDTIDGYPTTASGANINTGGHGDTEHTSTEAAALARIHTNNDNNAIGAQAVLDELADYLNASILGAKHALNIAHKHAAGHTHTDRHRLRCKGTTDAEGATCTQWACPRPDGHGGVINDDRCLDCGNTVDKREVQRRAESDARRARRHRKESAA